MKSNSTIIRMRGYTYILKISIVVFFLISVLGSCTSTKYAAVPCPDLPLNSNYSSQKKPRNSKLFAFAKKNTNRNKISKRRIKNKESISQERVQIVENSGLQNIEYIASQPDLMSGRIEIQLDQTLNSKNNEFVPVSNAFNPEVSSEIENTQPARYPAPEIISVKKLSDDKNVSTNIHPVSQIDERQVEALGLAGFISGIVGLLVLPLPLGIVAVVFGAISMAKINKNPDKFKGKGFAITSLVVGIVDIVWVLLVLAAI